MMRLQLGHLTLCAGHPQGWCIIVNTLTGETVNTTAEKMHALIRQMIAGGLGTVKIKHG